MATTSRTNDPALALPSEEPRGVAVLCEVPALSAHAAATLRAADLRPDAHAAATLLIDMRTGYAFRRLEAGLPAAPLVVVT